MGGGEWGVLWFYIRVRPAQELVSCARRGVECELPDGGATGTKEMFGFLIVLKKTAPAQRDDSGGLPTLNEHAAVFYLYRPPAETVRAPSSPHCREHRGRT